MTNLRILGWRTFQIFSVAVLGYIIYYSWFLEEHLASFPVSIAKYYARIYGFAMLWLSLILIYSFYQQICVPNKSAAIKKPNKQLVKIVLQKNQSTD